MSQPQIGDIRLRLSQLQRWNKILSFGFGLLALTTVTSLLLGAKKTPQSNGETPAVVRATRYDLLDEHGQPRAVLYMAKDGPILTFLDPTGKQRLNLFAGFGGNSGFILHDGTGAPRVSMVAESTRSYFTLHGLQQKMDLSLSIEGTEDAHVAIKAGGRDHGIMLSLTEHDAMVLARTDGNATVGAGLHKGSPLIIMKNAAGKTVFKKP